MVSLWFGFVVVSSRFCFGFIMQLSWCCALCGANIYVMLPFCSVRCAVQISGSPPNRFSKKEQLALCTGGAPFVWVSLCVSALIG
jgi:hypothetical protein